MFLGMYFLGTLFGTLPGTAGRLKFGIPCGMSVKNLASDLFEKDSTTDQKVTPRTAEKELGQATLESSEKTRPEK